MRFKKKTMAASVAAVMGLSLMTPALGAIVEPNPYGGVSGEIAASFIGVKSAEGGREMGSFVLPLPDGGGDVRVYCIETSKGYPSSLSSGTTLTNNELAAFVLGRYGNTTDDRTAAAVWYILGQDANLQTGSDSRQQNGYTGADNYSSINAIRNRILGEFATDGGPYSLDSFITLSSDKSSGTAVVVGTDKSGRIGNGVVDVTLSGDATFSDGTKTKRVTLDSAGNWRGAVVPTNTANPKVKISVRTVESFPDGDFTIYRNGGLQDVAVAGSQSPISFSDPTEYQFDTQKNPTISTVSNAYNAALKVGDTVTDTITVKDGKPGTTIQIVSRLYGPLASKPANSADAPAGTPLLNTQTINVTLDASGNATVKSAPVAVNAAGWYTYDTHSIGTADNLAYDARYGVPEETGQLTKYNPVITTKATAPNAKPGTPATDTITVTGGRPGATIAVQSRLYGPLTASPAQSPNAPAGTNLVNTQTVNITLNASGTGSATTTAVNLPAQTSDKVWYTYDLDFAGDASHTAYDAGYGVPAETFPADKYTPAITTVSNANTSKLKVGDTVTDTIKVTGGRPGATIKVQSRLYGPLAAQPKFSANAPAGAKMVNDVTLDVKLDASGNATVSTAPVAVEDYGWYTFDTDFAGDGYHDAYDHGYGVVEESGLLDKYSPTIKTTATAEGARGETVVPDGAFGMVGDVVNDTIVVEGARPNSTLTIQSRLYHSTDKPVKADNAPDTATLTETQDLTIVIDASGKATKDITSKAMEKSGWYSWDTDLAEDANHWSFDHGYGVPEETGFLAMWKPEATTKTSDQLVTDGLNELRDTVEVTKGKPGAAFTGSTTLYGPFATDPSLDGGVDLKDAPVVGTSKFEGVYDANGAATVVSEPQTTTGSGYYVWAEVIDLAPDVSEQFKQDKAKQAETSVEVNPTIATQVNDQKVLPGHTIHDTVKLTDIRNEVGGKTITNTVTGKLLGPVAPIGGECTTVDWTDAPVALELGPTVVTGDADNEVILEGYGEYTLPDDAKSLGCYTYTETLTSTVEGDDTPVVVEHEAGQESQTTIALKPDLSTQVSEQMVKPGASIFDTIEVWDTADTKFTMVAKLYGLADPGENRQCSTITNPMWERMIAEGSAKLLGEETIVGDKDGTYTTKPITLPEGATGCATWWEQAEFEGSESSTVVTDYGIVEETTTVLQPKVTTLAHQEFDYAGSLFTDTIFVKGTYGNKGYITGQVLGPIAGNDVGNGAFTCENLDWSKAPIAGEIERIEVNGDGEYTSSSIKTTTEGCYTFVESLTMYDGDVVTNTQPGEATETNYFKAPKKETPAPTPPVDNNTGGVDDNNTDGGGDADKVDGGGIDGGDPATGSWNAALAATGALVLVGAATAGGVAIRRKRTE